MAWVHNVNIFVNAPTEDSGRIWIDFRDLVLSSGIMSVVSSGDGRSAYSAIGDVFTASPEWSVWNSGIDNEISNTNAWICFRMVGTNNLEFLIQRHSNTFSGNADDFRIYASPSVGFSGGNATTRPTATDELQICGSSGGYAQLGLTTSSRLHLGVDTTPNGDGYHSFYLIMTEAGTTTTVGCFFCDALSSYKSGDTQPWVVGILNSTLVVAQLIARPFGMYDFGGTAEVFTNIRSCTIDEGSTILFPGNVNIQPENSETYSCPIIWAKQSSGYYKGVSGFLEWKGVGTRLYPDTIDLATVNARIYFDDVIVPWLQNELPL